MNNNDYIIRLEETKDYRDNENLVRESFWNVYRPGCMEHYLLHCLRTDSEFVQELDLVMEKANRLIGQIICVRTKLKTDDGRTVPVLTLGPIGIIPEFKRKGYGKILLDYALKKAKNMGFGAVFLEGNIDFYGKSGFTYSSDFGIRYHDMSVQDDTSFFLCRELIPGYLDGITGKYETPQGYYIDEDGIEEFDKQFPYKEKLKLPGQLFE